MRSSQKLRSVNLNQLPVLREVLRLESITNAADALHLSQPAVSNILKALRGHFDDQLISRDGGQMRRTVRGDELLVLLETSLSRVETAVQGEEFDISKATGPLRVAAVDNLIGLASKAIFRELSDQAPNLSIQFVNATNRLAEDLRSSSVDIAVTSTEFVNSSAISETLRASICLEPLAREALVCIAHSDDTHFSEGLSLAEYLRRQHASYTVDPEHPHTVERKHIREFGLRRSTRVATTINQSLPELVVASGCIAVVPISMAIVASRTLPIQYRKPPLALPDINWVVAWHEHAEDDPLVQWSRRQTLACAKELSRNFTRKIIKQGLLDT